MGDYLTSWDQKPEGPHKSADFAWVGGVGAIGIFRGTFFDRVGIVESISTGLLLYFRVYLRFSVQVLILVRILSIFGFGFWYLRGLRVDLPHVGHFPTRLFELP